MCKRWFDGLIGYSEDSPSCLIALQDIIHSRNGRVYFRTGESIGVQREDGYWTVHANGEKGYAHRIIWELEFGEIPEGFVIDHKDGKPGHNVKTNLKLCSSNKQNLRNTKMHKRNTSGVTGVRKKMERGVHTGWQANWRTLDGKQGTKYFSFYRYGDKAFELATEFRNNKIKELVSQGAYYTDRHGT